MPLIIIILIIIILTLIQYFVFFAPISPVFCVTIIQLYRNIYIERQSVNILTLVLVQMEKVESTIIQYHFINILLMEKMKYEKMYFNEPPE